MALKVGTLANNIEATFSKQRDSEASNQQASANDFAAAISDYAKDASIIVAGTPPLIPIPPPAVPTPDASVVGQQAKINPGLAKAGQGMLFPQINTSYTAMDPTMASISAGIMTYIATFTIFSIGGVTCTGATVPTAPPVFAPATAVGMNGGSIKDVAGTLADIIHLTFSTAIFNGTVINAATGAVLPGVLAPAKLM
tara:strand:- start:32 stop:622 length:591 start_codon:yes stop_codon:yes gene_type:complete